MKKIALVLVFGALGTAAFASLTKTFIASKSEDGAVLKLGNGSVWVVDSVDRVDSSIWLAADDVIVDDGSASCTHAQIIDTDEDGEAVCATEVK